MRDFSDQIKVNYYSDANKKKITQKYKPSWGTPPQNYSLFLYLEHDHHLKYDFLLDWSRDHSLLERNGLVEEGFVRSCIQYEICNQQKYLVGITSRQKLPKNIFQSMLSKDTVTRDKKHHLFRIRSDDGEHYFIGLQQPYCAVTLLSDDQRKRWVSSPLFLKKRLKYPTQETAANGYIFQKGSWARRHYNLSRHADWNQFHIALVPVFGNGELGGKIHHLPNKYCGDSREPWAKMPMPFFKNLQ